ncbi:unnamed protein product, partial [Vitis vinifera]
MSTRDLRCLIKINSQLAQKWSHKLFRKNHKNKRLQNFKEKESFHSFRWVNQWLGTVCNLLQFSRISEVAFRI